MGHFNESAIELDNDEKKNTSFKDIPVILRKDVKIIGRLVFFLKKQISSFIQPITDKGKIHSF